MSTYSTTEFGVSVCACTCVLELMCMYVCAYADYHYLQEFPRKPDWGKKNKLLLVSLDCVVIFHYVVNEWAALGDARTHTHTHTALLATNSTYV